MGQHKNTQYEFSSAQKASVLSQVGLYSSITQTQEDKMNVYQPSGSTRWAYSTKMWCNKTLRSHMKHNQYTSALCHPQYSHFHVMRCFRLHSRNMGLFCRIMWLELNHLGSSVSGMYLYCDHLVCTDLLFCSFSFYMKHKKNSWSHAVYVISRVRVSHAVESEEIS